MDWQNFQVPPWIAQQMAEEKIQREQRPKMTPLDIDESEARYQAFSEKIQHLYRDNPLVRAALIQHLHYQEISYVDALEMLAISSIEVLEKTQKTMVELRQNTAIPYKILVTAENYCDITWRMKLSSLFRVLFRRKKKSGPMKMVVDKGE